MYDPVEGMKEIGRITSFFPEDELAKRGHAVIVCTPSYACNLFVFLAEKSYNVGQYGLVETCRTRNLKVGSSRSATANRLRT